MQALRERCSFGQFTPGNIPVICRFAWSSSLKVPFHEQFSVEMIERLCESWRRNKQNLAATIGFQAYSWFKICTNFTISHFSVNAAAISHCYRLDVLKSHALLGQVCLLGTKMFPSYHISRTKIKMSYSSLIFTRTIELIRIPVSQKFYLITIQLKG